MYSIGIDVGSTFTKYCITTDGTITSLFMEKTVVRQQEYFERKVAELLNKFPNAEIISCGYGKKNVDGLRNINELTALARGVYSITGKDGLVLDIGGQDTKIILQEEGKLKGFFINDKCAAGSGMFLTTILNMVGMSFDDIKLRGYKENSIKLPSNCAVFAQSEIVELIANNKTEDEIVQAVLKQIFLNAKPLLSKINPKPILLSGGLSQIEGISEFASWVLGCECKIVSKGVFLAALGCTDCLRRI